MSNDERTIRDLVETWLAATEAGDVPKVLSLMADDVVFSVAGRKPFGKEEFSASAQGMKNVRIETKSEIQEITVLNGWAWLRNHLSLTITPPNGEPMRRSGYTLTILGKNPDGSWIIARDANMLTAE